MKGTPVPPPLKLLFLGLDGATWTLLDPLIEAGKLPHLAGLRRGPSGALRTCDPPYTFPAWKVISTGLAPDALGVFGWIGVDWARRDFVVPDARHFNAPEVWDHLAAAGLKVGVVGMPATWPVREIGEGSVMVAGPFARDDRLVAPADAPARYDLGPITLEDTQAFRADAASALALMLRAEDERFAASRALAPHVDVLFHTTFFCDPMQHFHWHDAATMEAVWTHLDQRIGELLETARPEHVVVASDHGFGPVAVQLNINRWLEDRGLFVTEGTEATSTLYRLGITRDRVLALAGKVGLSGEDLAKVVPLKLRRGIPNADGELAINRRAVVAWDATRALSADGFQVYVKDMDARRQVLDGLARLTRPDTGGPAFERVVDAQRESGIPGAPIVLTPTDGLLLAHKFGGELWKTGDFSAGWQATHYLDGVVAVRGAEADLEGARLVDVAPTLLALCGVERSRLMTGRTLAGREVGVGEPLPRPWG